MCVRSVVMRVPCRQWSVAAYRALLVSRREELSLPRHRLSVCKRSESQGGRRSYPCAAEPQPSSGTRRDKALVCQGSGSWFVFGGNEIRVTGQFAPVVPRAVASREPPSSDSEQLTFVFVRHLRPLSHATSMRSRVAVLVELEALLCLFHNETDHLGRDAKCLCDHLLL